LIVFILFFILFYLADPAQAILAATTGAHYRPDLANLAVARYHALARGINNAKRGISKQ
jgi:hypothetical protein